MKSVAVISLFFICVILNAQNGDPNLSKWHNNDRIDRSDYLLIKKSKLYCSLSNDKDFVYINLMIPDREVSVRILEDGLTVWINMDGKQDRKMGVRFPIGSQNAANVKNQGAEDNIATEDLVSQANTIELIGFISEQDRRFASQNSDNFRGAVKYSPNGDLYYRLVMPVAKLPFRNSKDGNGAMPFALGFEIGYIPPAGTKNQSKKESHSGSNALYWINQVKLASSK